MTSELIVLTGVMLKNLLVDRDSGFEDCVVMSEIVTLAEIDSLRSIGYFWSFWYELIGWTKVFTVNKTASRNCGISSSDSDWVFN